MQKKKTINAKMKTFLYYDDSVPQIVEFASAWLKSKRHRDSQAFPPAGAVNLANEPGYVGSLKALWEFKGVKIRLSGYANGKGFWGTDYSIYLAE